MPAFQICHPRERGDPEIGGMDPRFRGDDIQLGMMFKREVTA
jgi:hypothetical protein